MGMNLSLVLRLPPPHTVSQVMKDCVVAWNEVIMHHKHIHFKDKNFQKLRFDIFVGIKFRGKWVHYAVAEGLIFANWEWPTKTTKIETPQKFQHCMFHCICLCRALVPEIKQCNTC